MINFIFFDLVLLEPGNLVDEALEDVTFVYEWR